MASLEIEKKWIFTKGDPPIMTADAVFKESHTIYQWYIVATDDAQVRVSRRCEENGDRYTLNIKSGNGLVRQEVRIDITYKDFLTLIAQCDGAKPIKKNLFVYYLPSNRLLEVSLVDDDWWYAEVEFETAEEAEGFCLRDFVSSGFHDETSNPAYAMKNYWRKTRLPVLTESPVNLF